MVSLSGLNESHGHERRAGQAYACLVASARNVRLWDDALQKQIFPGDEDFIERMQALADSRNSTDRDIPRVQRSNPRILEYWLGVCRSREEAFYRAHTESGISMTQTANESGLSISRVSRLIKQPENDLGKDNA